MKIGFAEASTASKPGSSCHGWSAARLARGAGSGRPREGTGVRPAAGAAGPISSAGL